jgi:hypothetical protein
MAGVTVLWPQLYVCSSLHLNCSTKFSWSGSSNSFRSSSLAWGESWMQVKKKGVRRGLEAPKRRSDPETYKGSGGRCFPSYLGGRGDLSTDLVLRSFFLVIARGREEKGAR